MSNEAKKIIQTIKRGELPELPDVDKQGTYGLQTIGEFKKMPRYIVDAEKMQSLLEEEIEECGNPTADNNPIAYGTTLGLKMSLSYTKTLSTADAAPVIHAKWVSLAYDFFSGKFVYACSRCDRRIKVYHREDTKDYPYCHCGAKMDERIEENDSV